MDPRAPAYLRPAGQAGGAGQTAEMLVGVPVHLVGHGRPWTNEGHVPSQHVPQLGKLVQAQLAKDHADPRDARVVRGAEGFPLLAAGTHRLQLLLVAGEVRLHVLAVERVVGVDLHRAELEQRERLELPGLLAVLTAARPASADPFLGEDRGTRAIEPDRDRDQQEERSHHDPGHDDEDDVERALGDAVGERLRRTRRADPRRGGPQRLSDHALGSPPRRSRRSRSCRWLLHAEPHAAGAR